MLGKILVRRYYCLFLLSIFFLLLSFYEVSYAAEVRTLGDMAEKIYQNFGQIEKLLQGLSLIAGISFSISAIFKFKQHKDNPTQIPVGAPIALLFVGAALIYLPSLIDTTGDSFFTNPCKAVDGCSDIFDF